jgi:hypothetical protein
LVIILFMKKNLCFLTLLTTIVVFAACKKEKFKSEPQLKFKSVSPSAAIKSNIINFIASFTDDEGDIQDSVIVVYKRFSTIPTIDTVRLKMDPGKIPVARQGDLNIKFGYGELINGTFFLNLEAVDTQVSFGLIIRDKAGQRSNYIESDRITLKKL